MLKDSSTIIPYDDIDVELRDIIKYMNDIDGIETIECCSGHGEGPCTIWFKADDISKVTKLWYDLFYRSKDWKISINPTDFDIIDAEHIEPTYLLGSTISYFEYVYLAINNLKLRIKNSQFKYDHIPNENIPAEKYYVIAKDGYYLSKFKIKFKPNTFSENYDYYSKIKDLNWDSNIISANKFKSFDDAVKLLNNILIYSGETARYDIMELELTNDGVKLTSVCFNNVN